MMNIKEIAFNDDGTLNSAKGTFTKAKSKDKIYFWASHGLDYCGG